MENVTYQQSVTNDPYKIIQLLYRHLLKNLKKMKKYISLINDIELDFEDQHTLSIRNEYENELTKISQVSNEIILELISTLKSTDSESEDFVKYLSGLYLHQLKELNLTYVEMTEYRIDNIYNFFQECNEAWNIIIENKENGTL